jgi:hypothetical protein
MKDQRVINGIQQRAQRLSARPPCTEYKEEGGLLQQFFNFFLGILQSFPETDCTPVLCIELSE